MSIAIDVDDEAWNVVPDLEMIVRRAALAVLKDREDRAVSLLFTDDQTIADLNGRFRGKVHATNVLAFPAAPDLAIPPGEPRPLGDIVLAFGVIAREADEQGKPLPAHVSHLVIHGLLHLLGFDHRGETEAARMEAFEIAVLKTLAIENPYERH